MDSKIQDEKVRFEHKGRREKE